MNHCKDCKHFDGKKGECDRILGPQDRGYKDIYRQRYSDDGEEELFSMLVPVEESSTG